ncbi:protein of unknown function [Xenorhabdus doucetiae]|uniref:Uncharacterized protein n=1 Tax=Xenorhabdus doucetiae TaxID=351671 RepID=A0A068QV49_9GAMM|nr:protein of unknown function [Xenorhabdus doucetiae]
MQIRMFWQYAGLSVCEKRIIDGRDLGRDRDRSKNYFVHKGFLLFACVDEIVDQVKIMIV